MSGNTFGNVLRITTFGESHGDALGCVLDGVPAGIKIDVKEIQKELDRRKPGVSRVTTSRKEEDKVKIFSGVFGGKTLGTPIALRIRNENQRSKDYKDLKSVYRPGHADFTWEAKFGIRDYRGGGRSSGRETVARVAAGAIAQKILDTKKIQVLAFTEEIGDIRACHFDSKVIEKNSVRCADAEAAKAMEKTILQAKAEGDSIGGRVGILVKGVPAGLGNPVFDKIDALLAHALMSIGAVKGVEFGLGFGAVKLRGSEMNDEFIGIDGRIGKKTNLSGGMLGGISDGGEIRISIAVKPTASIAKTQNTVDVIGRKKKLKIKGRHDACIIPRVIPVAEAMVKLVLADLLLQARLDMIRRHQ